MGAGTSLERALARDKVIVLGAVTLVTVLAALYTIFGIGMEMSAIRMTQMSRSIGEPMAMASAPKWTPQYASVMFLMWSIMMIAMMTPSTAPTVLLFAALKRRVGDGRRNLPLAWLFLFGYLFAWAVFSGLATALQWAFQELAMTSGAMMTIKGRWIAAAFLIAAGVYQFTPLKETCLRHCQAPARFLSDHHRPGALGAAIMGAHHGSNCLGCCWALMLLLFVGGVMNLIWIAALALVVAIERLALFGSSFSHIIAVALIAFGSILGIA